MKLCNIHIKNLIILSVSGTFKGFKNWQKVAEIWYQLVHDRASGGLALFLIWRLHCINSLWTCMQNSFWRQIGNRPMPLTSSVMRQSISNFRLYCCSKKIQMLRKKVKLLLEQLQVCIFAEIVFGVRYTLSMNHLFWYSQWKWRSEVNFAHTMSVHKWIMKHTCLHWVLLRTHFFNLSRYSRTCVGTLGIWKTCPHGRGVRMWEVKSVVFVCVWGQRWLSERRSPTVSVPIKPFTKASWLRTIYQVPKSTCCWVADQKVHVVSSPLSLWEAVWKEMRANGYTSLLQLVLQYTKRHKTTIHCNAQVGCFSWQ